MPPGCLLTLDSTPISRIGSCGSRIAGKSREPLFDLAFEKGLRDERYSGTRENPVFPKSDYRESTKIMQSQYCKRDACTVALPFARIAVVRAVCVPWTRRSWCFWRTVGAAVPTRMNQRENRVVPSPSLHEEVGAICPCEFPSGCVWVRPSADCNDPHVAIAGLPTQVVNDNGRYH